MAKSDQDQPRHQVLSFPGDNSDLSAELKKLRDKTAGLEKNERRFRRLLENSRDIIFRISLPDGPYEYISPAALEMLMSP